MRLKGPAAPTVGPDAFLPSGRGREVVLAVEF